MSTTSGSSTSSNPTQQAVLLQCSLCNVPYDTSDHEPKLLSCHHSFCLACLRELAANRTAFRCPDTDCRKKTAVPKDGGGASSLPTNFYVSQVRDFVVVTEPATNTTLPTAKSERRKTVKLGNACDKHMNQPLLFFCETCMVPICMNCTVLDHDKNGGHRIKDIASAVKVHHDVMKSKMEKMERSTEVSNTGLRLLKRELSNLETTKETSEKHIVETFRQLALRLETRKEEMLSSVKEVYTGRKESILTQAQIFKRHAEKVTLMRDKCQEILDSGNLTDPIQAATNVDMMAQIDELCQTPASPNINNHSYIQFQYDQGLQEFIDSVTKLGNIQCDCALPTLIKYDVPQCTAGLKSTLQIVVKSIKGAPLAKCPLTVKITDPEDDDLAAKLVSGNAEGLYTVDVRPQMAGTHKISLYFLDYPIWGQETDFHVQSNDPVMKIEGIAGQTEMNRPTSVAICEANGNIYIADMGNKRILIYNGEGKLLAQFKIGSNKATAYDIKINPATEELLCSKVGAGEQGQTLANTISLFSLTGERKQQFVNGELRKSLFLAVNNKGQIITTDTSLNAFYIHSKEGVALKKIGSQGQAQGQFNFPSAVCIGKDDMILVSDTGNNRIQIFSKTGKFLHEFGGNKAEEAGTVNKGCLLSPRGIAADDRCVLVADSQNRVQVFKYDGTFLACIQSLGDPISEPYNLSLTKDGHVFVADFRNNCVKKYRYK